MISAAEARILAGPTPKERVHALEDEIKEAATEGKRSITLHGEFWENEGYSKTKAYREACEILEGLGYKVRFFYEERQFVDMYTIVEW